MLLCSRFKDELAESNRALEQKVQERTRELLQTLEILKATQAELMIENALLRSAEQSLSMNIKLGKSTNGCRDLRGTAGRPTPLQSFKAWRVLLHPEYTADGQI
jgi:nitrate/nitrite-specific signal transduction histidine kinase